MTQTVSDPFLPVPAARRALRIAATGSLATIDEHGFPFASLAAVATTIEGEPLFLLSDLAVHTQNLKRDPRSSVLLLTPVGEAGAPLSGARLTVTGRLHLDADAGHRRRFLARHEDLEDLTRFADFHVYRLAVSRAHLVAGFGRIADLERDKLLIDASDCAALVESEQGAIAHINDDHSEVLALYATKFLGMPDGSWKATGIDPDGLDLRAGPLRARLEFPKKIHSENELRAALRQFSIEAKG